MADQLAPNLLTVDPTTGAIGALFPGGVQIPEGSSNFPIGASEAVEWIDAAGAAWESIQASLPGGSEAGGGNHQLGLFSQRPTNPADLAELVLRLANHTGFGFPTSAVIAIAEDSVNLSAHQVDVIDSAGRSDFLQAGSPVKSLVGSGTLTWPGGTVNSNTLNVSLPGAAGVCNGVASAQGDVSDLVICSVYPAAGGVQIVAARRAGSIPAAPNNTTVSYLIWGT